MEDTYFRSGAVVFDDFFVVPGASPLPGPGDHSFIMPFFLSLQGSPSPPSSFLKNIRACGSYSLVSRCSLKIILYFGDRSYTIPNETRPEI